ncbi:MAG: glycosyltransferase family 4 protein [Candidatus Marinimicrobia bacterium]|jgi:glycosyltransferase involved in cell wall biosynthesis|nr:glycosyltransferase family 4 protein [Candidatus Neomarinimicrobiota bacterium]
MIHPRLSAKGGAENVIMWLSDALLKRGHDVNLISLKSNPSLWGDLQISNEKFIDVGFESKYFVEYMGRKIAPHIQDSDIVCAHNTPAHWWAAAAVRNLDKPVPLVWYCHEPYRITYFSTTDAESVNRIQDGTAASLPNYTELARRVKKRVKHEKIFKSRWRRKNDAKAMESVSLILSNSRFTAENVKQGMGHDSQVCRPGIPNSDPMQTGEQRTGIAFLSNFVLSKNIFGFLGALDLLVNAHGRTDIHCHFLGDGNDSRIEKFMKAKELEKYATFHGFVSEKEKQEILASVKLCVFVPLCEPFGLVTLESLRAGTPVIGSKSGGPREVIEDSGAGVLADPYDPNSIAEAILSIYDDEAALKEMGEKGRALVEDNYLISHFTDRFEKELETCLLNRNSREL